MQETDILLTVAEIGVALAGFASLATVLGRRFGPTDPLVNAIRLRGLLDAGISTLMLALLAVVLLQFDAAGRWIWRVSSLAGVVLILTVGVAAFRREKLRRHLPGFRKRASFVMFALVAAALVGFAGIVAGFAGDYGFEVFLAILCVLLLICCTMFVLVIASVVNPAAKKSADTE